MKGKNIKIRKAKHSDIEAIAEIKVMGWQTAYKGIIDDKYLNSMSLSDQMNNYKSVYSLNTVFIAETENEIVGFCRFYDYDNAVYEDTEIDCEIREIYVRPNMKRMGIGSHLFKHTYLYLKQKGKKKLYVGCFKQNVSAIRFYEKMGGVSTDENTLNIAGKNHQIKSFIYQLI